jgi:hypothetical protein
MAEEDLLCFWICVVLLFMVYCGMFVGKFDILIFHINDHLAALILMLEIFRMSFYQSILSIVFISDVFDF